VVRPARGGVDQSSGDAADEEVVVDEELNRVVELLVLLLEHGVELLSLGNGAGEAVKDESVSSTRATQSASVCSLLQRPREAQEAKRSPRTD
jgi:hypothetical protein